MRASDTCHPGCWGHSVCALNPSSGKHTPAAWPALAAGHLSCTCRITVQYGVVISSRDGGWHAHRLAWRAKPLVSRLCVSSSCAYGEAAVLSWLTIDAGGT
jgi:hypothetical protein